MVAIGIDKPLPVLRSDVEVFSGPCESDGSPVYIIHDPVSGSFSKIGWEEALVLQRLRSKQTLFSLLRELRATTTLNVTPEDVYGLCEQAAYMGLTMETMVKPAAQMLAAHKSSKKSLLAWLTQHYLYFRIPLVHPDKFLESTLPAARVLVSPLAKLTYAILALMGLYFLTQRFETYISTFSYFFNPRGFSAFAGVIVLLKAAHELGHAFVAKHYGLRVPTMGVAFMVFFPVAYSDVTDAWRLRNRRQRLQISLAGVKVELVIGAVALACWGLTQPGMVNSVCFILSSTTLISTLLVNLNPAMRFDGYYILSDVWGIDNMSQQTTLLTKWHLKRLLLGVKSPSPIPHLTRRRHLQMVLYAVYSWHYRFFLYIGIAVMVYHKFTKPLGMTLFGLEIFLFILRPVLMEISMIRKEKGAIRLNKKLVLTLCALFLCAGWAVFAMPRISRAPAVFLAAKSQMIYSPKGGQVVEIHKQRGDRVAAGDILIEMTSRDLESEIEFLNITIRQLRHDVESMSGSAERLGLVPEVEKQLASHEAELAGLMAQKKQLVIRAKMAGVISDLFDWIRPGCYVKKDEVLGHIVGLDKNRIDAFVSETEVRYIVTGKEVTFYPSDHTSPVVGRIQRINPIREEYVDTTDIGAAAVKELPLIKDDPDRMAFVESYYKVEIKPILVSDSALRIGTSGHLRYHTAKQSLALEFFEYCYAVFIRESGF